MAVIWQRQVGDHRFEVRSAGRSLRLYANGQFQSHYHPQRPWSGGVWDLLTLAGFALPPQQLRRVLVLGVGGGTVIRQLRQLLQVPEFVGVELEPLHLYVAREYFALPEAGVELHLADAAEWLRSYRGPHFDLIVDDLFANDQEPPQRAVQADAAWFRQLLGVLGPTGVIAMNCPSLQALMETGYCRNRQIRNQFNAAFALTAPHYGNGVGMFLRGLDRHSTFGRRLRQRLRHWTGAQRALLRYRIRRLSC